MVSYLEAKVYFPSIPERCKHLFKLLLGAQIVGVSTLGFSAIGGPGMETGIALAADHLVAVVFHCQNTQRWLNNTTSEAQHQVKGRLCNVTY